MHSAPDSLRISPNYSSRHWDALRQTESADWVKAADIIRDRLNGRFLRFAGMCLTDPYSGFVVLAIDSLLAETIQQFRVGEIDDNNRNSRKYVVQFLSGTRFKPDFDKEACNRFYEDIRCGLLHQAEAKRMWLIRRRQQAMLQKVQGGEGYIIDVQRFHAAVSESLDDYCRAITDVAEDQLRANLWKKMGKICSTRTARGLLYEDNGETSNASLAGTLR